MKGEGCRLKDEGQRMKDEGRRMKGAGCWIMVQEVHPVSDLLLNLGEKLCRYSCA